MSTELYPVPSNASTNSSTALYPASSGGEIDLRVELARTLYGEGDETAKGQTGLLRRMRTDDDDNLIGCPCVDPKTHEPDVDTPCNICLGLGYLWDEEWVTYYKVLVSSNEGFIRKNEPTPGGIANIPYAFFYVEYNVNPARQDKIIEVNRDLDGDVNSPYKRVASYSLATVEPFRSDQGRVEYFRIAATLDSILPRWKTY